MVDDKDIEQDKLEEAIETLQEVQHEQAEAAQAAESAQPTASVSSTPVADAPPVATPADAVHGFLAELQQMQAMGLSYAQVWEIQVNMAPTMLLKMVVVSEIKLQLIRDLALLGADAFGVKYAQTPEQLFGALYGGEPTVGGMSLEELQNG